MIDEVECDRECQKILQRRMNEKFLPAARIVDDVRTFVPTDGLQLVDGLLAGFPCQVS